MAKDVLTNDQSYQQLDIKINQLIASYILK